MQITTINTDKLAYDRLNGTRKIGPSYIYDTYFMHGTGTKRIVRHSHKSGIQWSVICTFACMYLLIKIRQYIIIQYDGSFIEVQNFNVML